MLTAIIPKLPLRNKLLTKQFYTAQLGFDVFGSADFKGYLLLHKDGFQIHFFEFPALNPLENYGQIFLRTNDIESLYNSLIDKIQSYIQIEIYHKNLGAKKNFHC
jgi:hypothetical protein